MSTYELRFHDSNSGTLNLEWYLQKVVGDTDSTRYPISGYEETSSEANPQGPTPPAANTYNDIMSSWNGVSIDLFSLMDIDSSSIKIKIEDGQRNNVKVNNNIESFIIYMSDNTKKKENVIQDSGATVSFTMNSGDAPFFIMTDGREISGSNRATQPFKTVQMHISMFVCHPSLKFQK